MKILLAEDDHNIAFIMRLCLEKMGGHEVAWAEDGGHALNLAQQGEFDLILLDGMMPKKSGVEVAREIRNLGLQTPIIFLTAKSEPLDLESFGAGFIAKPFEPTTICARIDEIMNDMNSKVALP